MSPGDPVIPQGTAPGNLLIDISDGEFAEISTLVEETFGIHLSEKKRGLVRGRLGSYIRRQGFRSFSEYLAAVRADPTGKALSGLIDRISTNHSYFYREPAHLELLTRAIVPELCERLALQPSEIRIWSAGCAMGEEPYSIALALLERFGPAPLGAGPLILATDVSLRALEQAARGVYPAQRIDRVPAGLRRYFRETGSDAFEVAPEPKRLVLFKRLNLMRGAFPFKRRFHVVFCRNVMIYFDQATRRELVSRIHDSLEPGGYLLIGHSETLGRDCPHFQYVRPTVYRRAAA